MADSLEQATANASPSTEQRAPFSVGPYGDGFERLGAAIKALVRVAPEGDRRTLLSAQASSALSLLRTQFAEVLNRLEGSQASKRVMQGALLKERRNAMRLGARIKQLTAEKQRAEAKASAALHASPTSSDARSSILSPTSVGTRPRQPAVRFEAGDDAFTTGSGASRASDTVTAGEDQPGGAATGAAAVESAPIVRCPVCTLLVPCQHFATEGEARDATPSNIAKLVAAARGPVAGDGVNPGNGRPNPALESRLLDASVKRRVAHNPAFRKGVSDAAATRSLSRTPRPRGAGPARGGRRKSPGKRKRKTKRRSAALRGSRQSGSAGSFKQTRTARPRPRSAVARGSRGRGARPTRSPSPTQSLSPTPAPPALRPHTKVRPRPQVWSCVRVTGTVIYDVQP